jgi:Tfp pilus assembly protein PilE
MNKSTMLRSEEARRQAQAMLLEAKQLQEQVNEERAKFFASDTRKVADLRAQRLARTAVAKSAATTAPRAVSRARS